MLHRVRLTMFYLNDHKEWWLPIVTTFIGVFSAAALTIYLEKQAVFSNINNVIKVARADICSSWYSTPSQEEIEIYKQEELPRSVQIPTIALSILRDNASSLSEFDSEISTQIVRFVTDIRSSGETYNFDLSKYSEFEVYETMEEALNEPKIGILVKLQKSRFSGSAKENLSIFEQSVNYLDYLLWLELRRRNEELDSTEFEKLIESEVFENRCDDQDQ